MERNKWNCSVRSVPGFNTTLCHHSFNINIEKNIDKYYRNQGPNDLHEVIEQQLQLCTPEMYVRHCQYNYIGVLHSPIICSTQHALHVHVVIWRLQKEKKKVHHFPGKTVNTSPKKTTGPLDAPEMCTGTLDRVMYTQWKCQGWHTLKRVKMARWRSSSLSNIITYISSANHKLEVGLPRAFWTQVLKAIRIYAATLWNYNCVNYCFLPQFTKLIVFISL